MRQVHDPKPDGRTPFGITLAKPRRGSLCTLIQIQEMAQQRALLFPVLNYLSLAGSASGSSDHRAWSAFGGDSIVDKNSSASRRFFRRYQGKL